MDQTVVISTATDDTERKMRTSPMTTPPTVYRVLICWVLLCAPCFAKTTSPKPRQGSEYLSEANGGVFPSSYREDFERTLREHPHGRFARAYHGNRAALHIYFSRALDVSEEDDTDAMSYVLLKILFGCRDFRFSRVLETEDYATRQAVGRMLNDLLVENHLRFPLTRSTYRFRRAPSRPVAQRD
jgi:hypothetical protein